MRKGPARDRRAHRVKASAPSRVGVRVPESVEESAQWPGLRNVLPNAWLEQLLIDVVRLPLAEGERAVVETMVASLAAILPRYAVGACFVPASGRGPIEQVVVKRLPRGGVEVPSGVDPTRIFPGSRREHVVSVPGSAHGSTLHVASDHDELDREHSPVAHLFDRAAAALAGALSQARDIAARRSAEAQDEAFQQRMLQADKLATFGQIAASLVHELNNPLTSIVAYSDYLIRKTVVNGPRGST